MNQFDRTPAVPFIQNYIARHADSFGIFANNLGLPFTAAIASASAVAEEMRGVYSAAGIKGWFPDTVLDDRAGRFTDLEYASKFSDSLPQILDGSLNSRNSGLSVFYWNKATNPMADDVGPGNVNFGSASVKLLSYLNDPSNANDPLNLWTYSTTPSDFVGPIGPSNIAFSRFFADLNSLDSPTTAAISMLNIADGYQFLREAYGSAFTNLAYGTTSDQQTQVGLLAALSKIGQPGFIAVERFNLTFGQLPDPSKLAGGGFAVDNFAATSYLLSRDPVFAFAPDQYMAAYAAKLFGPQSSFADRFSPFDPTFPSDRLGSWTSLNGASAPIDPLVANGILPDYTFLNGMLFNTQSGQMAFGLSDGLSGTTLDWSNNFANNSAGSINQLNQTAWQPWYSSQTTFYNTGITWRDFGSVNPGFSYDAFDYLTNPIVLDLTGAGLNITELGSSGQFVDMTGTGYQSRTAWAGAGNGVLVFDVNGSGSIDSPQEIQFTDWDPTATTDMQALRDVFDTNHNGQLDAGDTNFAAFKVLVTNADGTTTLRTLAELGIASINLTTDNNRTVLADGSVIAGQTTFTRADGSTGTAADVSLAYDGNGYATQQTVTHNADGSTTIDVKAINPDGSLAGETVTTTSADGLSRVVKFDHSGSGIFDQTQTIVSAVNADGSRTKTISNFDVTATLRDRTVTTTSLNGQTVTIARDIDGNGQTDQTELRVTNANGSKTITVIDLNADGSVRARTVSTTSQDGLTKQVQVDSTGAGVFDQTRSSVTVVGTDGTRTETIQDLTQNGSLRDKSITVTSADGRNKTTQSDLDGNGTIDRLTASSIVVAADGSSVTTQTDRNGDGSVLIDKTVTALSADGLSRIISRDLDGNGTFDTVTTDVTVSNANGSKTQTVTDRNADGSLRDQVTSVRGADGRSRSIQVDSNGDGVVDRTETIVVAGDGSSVDTVSDFNINGSLRGRTVTSVSANGLATTVQQDLTGSGTFDRTHSDVIVVNANGSRTETVTDTSANGALLGRLVTLTSADGLSITTQIDANGDGTFETTRATVTALNADGSRTETITDRNADGSLRDRTIVSTSADRLTVLSTIDANGDGHVDQTRTQTVSAAGVKLTDVSDLNANGSLRDRTVSTVSANGLSVTTQTDVNGDGVFDGSRTDVTVLNADGSRTQTISGLSGIGNLLNRTVASISANGLSVTTQSDANGDGVFDRTHTNVTVLNADGGRTETIVDLAASGATIGRTVSTSSANGLSVTMQRDVNGDGVFDAVHSDVTVLNSDGSRTETVTDRSGNGALLSRAVTTANASGTSVSTSRDINGDGITDQTRTVTVDAAGNTVDTISDLKANGAIQDRVVTATSASGLVVTTQRDNNGDGVIDQTRTDVTVLNANGSRTRTVTGLNGSGSVLDRTVVTTSADGLSTTTQWDNDGNGAFDLTETKVVTLNSDGSRVETVTDLNGDGSLKEKVTTTTSADGNTVTVQRILGGVTSTVLSQTNADGSIVVTRSDFNADGSLRDRVVTTTSASGLSVTTQRDGNGDGTIEATRTHVTVLNTNGTRVETVTNQASGATIDRTVITTSADGLSTTTQYDLTGSGAFGKTRTDVKVLNADGSTTETVIYTGANGALISRFATTTSADGLSITKKWDTTGSGSYDQIATDVTVINADGSRTEAVRALNATGGLISEAIVTTSADGQTQTKQSSIPANQLLNQTQTTVRQRNADGSTTETLTDFNTNGSIKDRAVTITSGDGMTVTTTRDNNGDGVNDQTDVIQRHVDGSSVETVTNFASGVVSGRTILTTSVDGLTRTTQQDLNGDGTIDRTRSDVTVVNFDGSRSETITDTNSNGTLHQKGVLTTSADGRTRTLKKDTTGAGFFDLTELTNFAADGSSVTLAKNFNASVTKTAETTTSVSADGRTKTTQIDSNADGVIDRTESTRTNIDGTTVTDATDLNANGTVKVRQKITTTADGRVKVTFTDTKNSGTYDLVETDTTNIDGTRRIHAVDGTGISALRDYDANGNIISEVFQARNGSTLTRRYINGVEAAVELWDSQGQQQTATPTVIASSFGTSLGDSVIGTLVASSLAGLFVSMMASLVKTPGPSGVSQGIGQAFGSAIGRAIAGDNQFVQLAAGTVVGAIGKTFGQVLSGSLTADASKLSMGSTFSSFGLNIASAAAGTVSSYLIAELGTALGLSGYGAQLFNSAVGAYAGSVLNTVLSPNVGGLSALSNVLTWTSALNNAALAVSGTLGSILANQLVPAQTAAGALGGQLMGAVGSLIGLSLAGTIIGGVLNFVLPGIGSLIGTILGTVFGDIFAGDPQYPYAENKINAGIYGYSGTQIYEVHGGGDANISTGLANAASDVANAYISSVNGTALAYGTQLHIGYQTVNMGTPYFWGEYKWMMVADENGELTIPYYGVFYHSSASAKDTVNAAAVNLLHNTEVIGGNLLMKRAHQHSTYSDTLTLSADLQIAVDYARYLDNREMINALIAANPNSAFAAGWAATFARVNDLHLRDYGASDFLGGLIGFLDSVKKAGLTVDASNVSVQRGNNGSITIVIHVPNGVNVPGELSAYAPVVNEARDPTGTTLSFVFADGLAAGGFQALASNQSTSSTGNNLWFGNANASNNFTAGSGSYNILVGGALRDVISTGNGGDFVDGGAGNDEISGGAGNDFLRGGEGADLISGGGGDDQIAGDGANDNLQGGAGNDTLTGGLGSDYLQGDVGNDRYTFSRGDGADTVFDDYRYTQTVETQVWVESGYWYSDGKSGGGWIDTSHYETRYTTLSVHGDGGSDTLVFGVGISASDIAVLVSGNDLIVGVRDPGNPGATFAQLSDTITLKDWFDPLDRIESFRFADGTSWNISGMVVGGGGNDTLAGGAGADVFAGRAGNDTYTVNHAGDVVLENGGEGTDTVQTSLASYALTANVENLLGTAATGQTLSGNAANNVVTGNAANDVLIGGGGNDTLDGAGGINTAVFSGNLSHYLINYDNATQKFLVTDQRSGSPDGIDVISNVNFLRFADGTFGILNLAPNHAPQMSLPSGANVQASPGQILQLSSLFSATDADNNELSYYIYDSTADANSGHFVVNGTVMAAGVTHTLTAAQLAQATFVAGTVSDQLVVQASDGQLMSGSGQVHVNVAVNHAPALTAPANISANPGQVLSSSSLFSATDTDDDTLTYFVYDGNSDANSGHFVVNGAVLAAGVSHTLTAAQLAQTTFVAGSVADDLFVLASDGLLLSDSKQIHIDAAANHGPVLTTPANVSANPGQVLLTSNLFGATDADNNALTYFVYDANADANSGHFVVDGAILAAGVSHTLTAAQLAQTTFVAGTVSDDLFVLASDGLLLSNSIQVHVGSNHAPSLTGLANVTANVGQVLSASDLFSATDVDGDVVTYFVYDGTSNPDSGHFVLNGVALSAGVNYTLSAAEFSQATFVAGTVADDLFVLASDGRLLSNSEQIHLAVNHAPILTAPANVDALPGQVIAASGLFGVSDADNDTLTYFVYDGNANANSGHFMLNGTALAAGVSHTLSAAEFAQTTYVAGTMSDDLSVLSSDGRLLSNSAQIHVAVANHAPVLNVPTENVSANAGQLLSASSLLTVSDADNDALTYFVYDGNEAANSGHFMVNGTALSAGVSHTLSAAEFAQATFVAGSVADDLYVLASDGDLLSNSGHIHVSQNGLPVILDLDGNGIDVTPLGSSSALFDMDGAPGREHTAWAGNGDGFLVIDLGTDRNPGSDGVIDQTQELVFTQWAPGATSDMQALRDVFDTNHNGLLDQGDSRWSEFRIWQDADGDGVSRFDELKTLDTMGITSIGLEPSGPAQMFSDGSRISGVAAFTRTDGTVGAAGDAGLAFETFNGPPVASDRNGALTDTSSTGGFLGNVAASFRSLLNDDDLVHDIIPAQLFAYSDSTLTASLSGMLSLPGRMAVAGSGGPLGSDIERRQYASGKGEFIGTDVGADSQLLQLIQAMGTHSSDRSGFDTSSWTCVMPTTGATPQDALAANWRS